MYLVLFSLLTVVGASAAWRSNPLYSTRSTLKFLAVLALAIAAVIGLVIAAVNLTIGKSPIIAFTTLGVAIVVGTLTLIFIIMGLTNPRPAAIPPSTPLVRFHRQKTYKWFPRLAIFSVVFVLCEFLLAGTARDILGVLGGMTIFLGLVLLPTYYFSSRIADRSLTALEYAPWVHWQYDQAQSDAWKETQVQRAKSVSSKVTRKRDWFLLALGDLALSVVVAAFIPFSPLGKLAYGAFIFSALFGAVAWARRSSVHAPDRLRAKLQKVSSEAFLGPDGIFCDGVLTQWLTTANFLVSASIDERQPRSLLFHFNRIVAGAAAQQIIDVPVAVLIPDDSATTNDSLAHLQQELTAKCPTASIHLA